MNTYWSKEPYPSGSAIKGIFLTKAPVVGADEAVILTGEGLPLLFEPGTKLSAIRKGKYTQLVRIKTSPQNVSGEVLCYCRDQIYQFRIRYRAVCHVCKPMEVLNKQFPDLQIMADEHYRNLFSSEALHYDMRDTVAFQQAIGSGFKDSLQVESGVQIGPLQGIQVEMDGRYRTHMETLAKDKEHTEVEINRINNANTLNQVPISDRAAMAREVLDGRMSADQMIQEMKRRKVEDFSQLRTILEQLNEMRTAGLIGEIEYQTAVAAQLCQIAPALKQPEEQTGKFDPLPSDL